MKGGGGMSEFKAQMLGLIIVLGLFAVVQGVSQEFFDDTWTTVRTYESVQINDATGIE